MRKNIRKLLASEVVSNYRIHKDTGISQATLSDYATGKSDLGNMKLNIAEKLNDYYIKKEEENKMKFEELKERVADNIVLTAEGGIYYADVVEENSDEDRLAQANNIKDLHQQLKGFGQIKRDN